MKNIKRYRRDLERDGSPLAERDETGRYIHLGQEGGKGLVSTVIPVTYVLVIEIFSFETEFLTFMEYMRSSLKIKLRLSIILSILCTNAIAFMLWW